MNKIDQILQYRTKNALLISTKKYEMAMSFSDITTFEYDVRTKKILIEEVDFQTYGMPTVMQNGVEEVLTYGAIAERSFDKLRWLYRQMDEGKENAKAVIYANTVTGDERIFEIRLKNIFDENGVPVYAVGVRKDITELSLLKRDKEFGQTMASDQMFLYDVNINTDEVLSYNKDWASDYGFVNVPNFMELKAAMLERFVEPQFCEEFSRKLSKDYIVAAFNQGKHMISLDYRKKKSNGIICWFRKKVHIIKDYDSDDIFIRCYFSNIDEQKKKEMKASEEQKRYEGLVAKSTAAYSLNITQDKILSGHENWGKQFNIRKSDSYSNMTYYVMQNIVYHEDRDTMNHVFSRENLLENYLSGEHELSYEYRRRCENNSYIWVRADVHLYEDPYNNDIKAFFYVENINKQKAAALELQFKAEHDLLSGLYNKISFEKHVEQFLQTDVGKISSHAFIMLDVDYFKLVNDNFGHAFGDAVLSQIGQKLTELFRDIDIIGRIGGDEFVVFMKNVSRDKVVLTKCQELCDKITDTFTKNGVAYKISASIGVAFFMEHGENYHELYRHADTALYASKEKGRNCFTLYNPDMVAMDTSLNDIEESEHLLKRNFEVNTTECVFRILYESEDKTAAIESVLELIGKHYDFSRAYVFENSADDTYMSNTFEWCNRGISSEIDNLAMIPYSEVGDYKEYFNADGIFYLPDLSLCGEQVRVLLEPQGIKSMLQFSIIKHGEFKGYIGFDECHHYISADRTLISDLQNISNILGVFVAQMRYEEELIRLTSSLKNKNTDND